MRIVIGGEDVTALRLTEELMEGHQVSLICPESARATRLDRLDADVVYGSITSRKHLMLAGIEGADLFVAASLMDENNLVACVTAKRLNVKRCVCFLQKVDLQTTEEDRSSLQEALKIDQIIVPATELAEVILDIVVVPGALDVHVFLGGQVHLLNHVIEEGSRLTQGPLRDINLPAGVVLVMGKRGGEMFVPKGQTEFLPGDKVTAMGTKAATNLLLYRYLRGAAHGPDERSATIVGGGSVGLAVMLRLEALGWDVKLLESDRERAEEIAPLVKGLVLHGDGTDLDLLESERIGDSPVLVAVTSNDEKNLLVSLLAKQLGVPRILTRVDLQPNERLFEAVGVDVVLSAQGAAIQLVLKSVGHTKADLLAELEHGDAEVIELEVPADLEPTALAGLNTDLFAIVGAIIRHDRVVIPSGENEVRGGDRLLVFCKREHEREVREFFTSGIKAEGASPRVPEDG